MTSRIRDPRTTGSLGPFVLFGGLLLLLASPLIRGGNRYPVLIPLEFLGLFVLTGVSMRLLMARQPMDSKRASPLFIVLLLAPLWLALVQLVPLPPSIWAALSGRDVYLETLKAAGMSLTPWRPVSVSPDATAASLLAGIPVAAALLLGYLGSLRHLNLMLGAVVVVAFAQVMLGLLQIAGGEHSPLFFGVLSYGPPIGTFANRNHFANYLAMALAGYVWLAYEAHRNSLRAERNAFGTRHRMALWAAGGLVLVLGILMTRSRGAAFFGLPMAALGLAVVSLRINGWSRGVRLALALVAALVFGAAALMGLESLTSRVSLDQLASSAGFRTTLARTSLEGAIAFWPWGSGWGTYDAVYPRFQPLSIAGFANHAHMDYIEMLFEGGIFFVILAVTFLWLAGRRAHLLFKMARRDRRLDREAMAAALCGLGLMALLLHSLVEFNMRIPANAILGALLAGVYLRPLDDNGHCDD